MTEHQLFLFLAEVVVLVSAARLGGELAIRAGIPPVVGELVLGVLLGPSCFGWIWPAAFQALFPADPLQRSLLQLFGWLGVIFLVVKAGVETRLGVLRHSGKVAIASWIGGFGVPLAAGTAVGFWIPEGLIGPRADRLTFALFIGVALSISAIPVIARILLDLGLLKTRVGTLVISLAVADDTAGWVMLALVTAWSTAGASGMSSFAWTLAATLAFLLAAFTVGERLVALALRRSRRLRAGNGATFATLVLVFTGGMLTQAIGVHLVLGSFVVAVLIGRSWPRDHLSVEAIQQVGLGFFVPFFFAYAGVSTDLTTLKGSALAVAVTLLAVACASKFVGAGGGALLAGLPFWEAAAVGAGGNARGAMELVIAAIGLSLGILTPSIYATLVLIAVTTSLMAAPLIRYCVRKGQIGAGAAIGAPDLELPSEPDRSPIS